MCNDPIPCYYPEVKVREKGKENKKWNMVNENGQKAQGTEQNDQMKNKDNQKRSQIQNMRKFNLMYERCLN
jgi:hypothetical protein